MVWNLIFYDAINSIIRIRRWKISRRMGNLNQKNGRNLKNSKLKKIVLFF